MWFEDDPYPSLDDAGRNTISNQIGCSLAAHPFIKSLAVAQQNARNLSPFAFALEFYPVHTNEGFQLNILPSGDRKSTRLNSSHQIISYAVFCLKKKNNKSR